MLKENEHEYVLNFKKKWDGDVIELTNLKTKSEEEIYKAVMQSSTIAVQTCFVNGSDGQFHEMFHLLSKIKETKEIYIPQGARLGDFVLEVVNVNKGFGELVLIENLNLKEMKN